VADVLAVLRRNAAARARLLAERDQLIREARDANVPVVWIAEAVGLTRMQVHRILKPGEQ
jgi:hypothetical protein